MHEARRPPSHTAPLLLAVPPHLRRRTRDSGRGGRQATWAAMHTPLTTLLLLLLSPSPRRLRTSPWSPLLLRHLWPLLLAQSACVKTTYSKVI